MILDVPALAESDKLPLVSTPADMAYPRLLGAADDWGRAEWSPRKILARVWPKRRLITESHVRRWLEEYDRVRSPKDPEGPGLLRRYSIDGVEYFEWTSWKGVTPSRRRFMRCPPPPWADPAESALYRETRFHKTAERRKKSTTPNQKSRKSANPGTGIEEKAEKKVRLRASAVPAVPAVPSVPTVPAVPAGGAEAGLGEISDEPARPPAASASGITWDPNDPVQAQLVGRCYQLAAKDAAAEGREATPEDVLEILRCASCTPGGKTLHDGDIRTAPRRWLEETLRACDRLEDDMPEPEDEPEEPERPPPDQAA